MSDADHFDLPEEAKALLQDPRIAEGKRLILDAVRDHQSKIVKPRPPAPSLSDAYTALLSHFAELRGGKLYFPYVGCGLGNGSLVQLMDGSVKYDFICGIGPHYWGHSHPDILSVALEGAIADTIMQGNLQQNYDSIEFCELITKASGLDHCFLSTTGAMANENALKIAFQKKFPANRILAFERCFIGRTLALSQITDKPAFREGLPLNYHIDYIPFFDPQNPEESTKITLTALKKHLRRYPKQHAIMCLELVQGEGGFHVGTKEFFHSLVALLKEHDIAIFADEVQSFGRTPELFAYQHFGLQDYVDIASIGKLSQVCATLYRKEFNPRPGLLSQTFTGSTTAIRAGKFIIQSLLSGGYYGPKGKIQEIHSYMTGKLEALSKSHPDLVQGPFGIGTMIAFTPFDGESQRVTQFVQNLFHAGVMSFVAGANPTRVRFLLPIGSITKEDIDNAMVIIEETLRNTVRL